MTCSFFGHKDTPDFIKPLLEKEIRRLVENEGYDTFLVGNQGQFDAMVYSILKYLQTQYPTIRYYVVLAYLPNEKSKCTAFDYADTIYPEELETVPYRFAISRRNRWMVERSHTVICYVGHTWGGAYQAVSLAKRKTLSVINLAQSDPTTR